MTPSDITSLFFLYGEMACGLLLNLFISLVLVRGRAQVSGLNVGEKILLITGSSNILLQLSQAFNFAIYFFFSNIRIPEIIWEIRGILFFASSFVPAWVTALLCSFYSIKITTFQHQLFAFFRMKLYNLPLVMSWSVVAAIVLSSLAPMLRHREITPHYATNHSMVQQNLYDYEKLDAFIIGIFGFCLPFLIVVSSLVMTIKSLLRHLHGILKTMQTISSSHLRGHQAAIRTMSLMLTLYVLYFLFQVPQGLHLFPYSSPWYWVCVVVQCSYSSFQAIIIITGNSKLRQAVRCFIFTERTLLSNSQEPNIAP